MQEASLDHIRRLSRMLKLLVVAAAMVVAAALLFVLWRFIFDFPAFSRAMTEVLFGAPTPITLTSGAMAGLAVLAVANAALILAGLHAVWSLFDRFEEGRHFSADCGRLLRRIGVFVLLGALSSIVTRMLAILLITYANPPRQKMLAISIGSNEILLLLLAGLLYALGHIMVAAEKLEADYRSFV